MVGYVIRRGTLMVYGGHGRRRTGQRPRYSSYAFYVLLRVTIQPTVDAQHNDARYVEANARRDDRVRGRQVERAGGILGGSGMYEFRLGWPVQA